MTHKFLKAISLGIFLFFASVTVAYAVPVRSYVNVGATSGNYSLRSENGGNGNVTPGSTVTVDSYLFQCRIRGTAACSTQYNSDAVLVTTWHNNLIVPALNQQTSSVSHSFSLPYGQCGRIQYDQGIVGIDGAIGGKVYDFGRDCDTPVTSCGGSGFTCPSGTTCQNGVCSSGNSCTAQMPVNTQFRPSGNGAWVSGNDLSRSVKAGQSVDVNCFAKNGTTLLDSAYIEVRTPNGQTSRVSNTAELRNFQVTSAGSYSFSCKSASITNCTDTDTFTLFAAKTATCDSLQVVSGNDSLVPAKVTLRTRGTDDQGSTQQYRYYFGDGEQQETSQSEVTHEYKSSGTFIAKSEIKDSQGNWRRGASCEAQVRVKPSKVESHKSECSNLFITADNNGRAPSKVKFEVTAYDNKGDLQGYKVDFGTGDVQESKASTDRTFEHTYTQAGTYTIRAYAKDSEGNWVVDTNACRRTLTISSTKPLTRQPATGTPTVIPLIGMGCGTAACALELVRRKFLI